jgi:nucleoside-diphosphate-sugar epimerase
MTHRLFIFGLGFSGLEIAGLARSRGWDVGGTCTQPEKAKQLRAGGIEAVLFDGTTTLPTETLATASHVLCTIAPGTSGDPALVHCAGLLGQARWLGYLSTTGVYGDHGGGWVDEATPAAPAQPRSVARLAAERAWQALGTKTGAAVDIFRLPGIYGPGRSPVDQVKAGTARRIDKPGQVFSRIHVTDLAHAVVTAMARGGRGSLYNIADDLPESSAQVMAFACKLLGVPAPPLVSWAEAEPSLTAMARSFYAENRRVRNERMKRELGITLRYPTYREGLRAIAGLD